MSETRTVVLRTGLFEDHPAVPALESLPERLPATEVAIDGDIAAMSEADWDRVLDAVLAHDRCITL